MLSGSLPLHAGSVVDSLQITLLEKTPKSFHDNDELFIISHELAQLAFDSVMQVFEVLPDSPDKAYALSFVAFYARGTNIDLAEQYMEKATQLAVPFDDLQLAYWINRHQAFIYQTREKFDLALQHFRRSDEIAKQMDYQRGQLINMIHYAEIYAAQKSYEKAFEYAYRNIRIREDKKLEFGSGYAYQYLGELFNSIEDYPEAFRQFSTAEDIYRAVDMPFYVGIMLDLKTSSLSQQNRLDEALSVAHEAKVIFEDHNDEYFLAEILRKMGTIFYKKEKYQLALEAYQQSLQFGKENDSNTLERIGDVFFALGDLNQSEKYYQRVLAILLADENDEYISEIRNSLAEVFLKKKAYVQAKEQSLRSIENAKAFQQNQLLLDALNHLVEAHHGLNEDKELYTVQKEIFALSKDIQQKLEKKNTENISTQFKVKEQRTQLEQENQLIVKEQKWANRINVILTLGALVISVLLLYIISTIRKRNKTLGEKNIEIAQLNESLEAKVSERTLALKAKQKELSLIYNNTQDFMGLLYIDKDETPILESFNQPYFDYLREKGVSESIENIRGMKFQEYMEEVLKMSKEEIQYRLNYVRTVCLSKRILSYETKFPRFISDNPSFFNVTFAPVIDESTDTCSRVIFSMHNITERLTTQQALVKSEQRLSTIYNASQDFIGLIDQVGDNQFVIASINQPAIDFMLKNGVISNKKDILNLDMNLLFKDVYGLSDQAVNFRFENMTEVFKQKRTFRYESLFAPSDTTKVYFETTISPILDRRGNCTQALYVARDITSSKIAKDKITESEKRLSMIFNGAKDQMFIFDIKPDGTLIFEDANQAYKNTWANVLPSQHIDTVIGKDANYFLRKVMNLPEAKVQERLSMIQKIISEKRSYFYEESFYSKAYEQGFTMDITTTPILNKDNVCEKLLFVLRDVTKKIAAQKALAESEKRLSAIYNSSQDFIGLIRKEANSQYIVESFNQPSIDLLTQTGWKGKVDQLWGLDMRVVFKDFFGLSPDLVENRIQIFQQVTEDHHPVTYKNKVQFQQSKTPMDVEVTVSPVLDQQGLCTHVLFCIRDITLQTQIEAELRDSEAHAKTLFEHSPIIIWEEDFSDVKVFLEALPEADRTDLRAYFDRHPETLEHLAGLIKVIDINQTSVDFYDMGNKETHIKEIPFYFVEASWDVLKEEFIALANGASTFESEIPIINKKGEILQLLLTLAIPPEYIDNWKSVIVSFVDITERENAKEALMISEKRLSTIYNSSQDVIGLIRMTPEGQYEIESVNQPSIELMKSIGVPMQLEDFQGMNIRVLFEHVFNLSEALVQERLRMIDEVFQKNKTHKFQSPFAPKGIDIQLEFETIFSPILDANGKCTHALYTARDITESEIAKNKLLINERRLASVFNGAKDQMAIFDIREDGELIFEDTNQSFKEGWKIANVGIDLNDIYQKDIRYYLREVMRFSEKEVEKRFQVCHRIVQDKKPYNYEEQFLGFNNRKYILDVAISPILDDEDICRKLLFVLRDVTLKHKARERMISKILETEDRERSRFAKELHDSLGQNLTVASLNLNFVKKEVSKLSTDVQKKFEAGFYYLKEAIQESRNIAHNLMPKAIADFGYILTIESLLDNLTQTTDIHFTFYDNLKGNRLSKDHELSLYRITQEAINNILKHAEATEVSVQLIKHKNSVILTIEDNGKGFQKTDSMNSFGLNSMKNRARALSGVLDIDSAPQKGTSITLEIPI